MRDTQPYIYKITALFFIGFLLLAVALAVFSVRSAYNTHNFEDTFNEAHPLLNPAKALWGAVQYHLFKEGRDGVIIGDNGWLYTTEEFEYAPALYDARMQKIIGIDALLNAQNIDLIVALLPAKSRKHVSTYNDTIAAFKKHGIAAPSIPREDITFLKTDTHWSPEGAKATAEILAHNINLKNQTLFKTVKTGAEIFRGDLTRYIPGAPVDRYTETINTFETHNPNADLFGDQTFDITLVGTSYSADPRWHFEGFLKTALQTDILNVSDEGLGPFAVMENWLKSEAFKAHKPKLVVWEIPMRTLTMKDKAL